MAPELAGHDGRTIVATAQLAGKSHGLIVFNPTKEPSFSSVRMRIRVAKRTPVLSPTPGTVKMVGKPKTRVQNCVVFF